MHLKQVLATVVNKPLPLTVLMGFSLRGSISMKFKLRKQTRCIHLCGMCLTNAHKRSALNFGLTSRLAPASNARQAWSHFTVGQVTVGQKV